MPSSDLGTRTTTCPAQSVPQAAETAGTASSASSAKDRSRSPDCPTPSTRLCAPRTTLTVPWSQSCSPVFAAGLSEVTDHRPVPSRARRRVRAVVTGALS